MVAKSHNYEEDDEAGLESAALGIDEPPGADAPPGLDASVRSHNFKLSDMDLLHKEKSSCFSFLYEHV